MTATATETLTSAKKEAKEGREPNGRFAPGNPGGPGNPYARTVAEYRKALLEFVSIEELGRIVSAIQKKAEQGDVAAAKLIFQYVLGKPTTPVDPDLVAVDEWQKLLALARPPREMSEVMNSVPAQKACDLTRITWPCAFETNFAKPLRSGFQEMDERDAKAAGVNPAARQTSAPIPNGENGGAGSRAVIPIGNGENGEEEDWLLRFAREALAEPPSPNGKKGKAARKKRKRQR